MRRAAGLRQRVDRRREGGAGGFGVEASGGVAAAGRRRGDGEVLDSRARSELARKLVALERARRRRSCALCSLDRPGWVRGAVAPERAGREQRKACLAGRESGSATSRRRGRLRASNKLPGQFGAVALGRGPGRASALEAGSGGGSVGMLLGQPGSASCTRCGSPGWGGGGPRRRAELAHPRLSRVRDVVAMRSGFGRLSRCFERPDSGAKSSAGL
jgi:hypothetical protein